MPLIILIAVLCGLRFFEVWKFAELSWWWISGLIFVAFLWFEFFERMLGLDKRKEDLATERMRKERLEKTFGKPPKTK